MTEIRVNILSVLKYLTIPYVRTPKQHDQLSPTDWTAVIQNYFRTITYNTAYLPTDIKCRSADICAR